MNTKFIESGRTNMINGVHHIGLRVDDMNNVEWLSHVISEKKGNWSTCPNVYIRLDASDNSQVSGVNPRPVNLPGIAHICLQSRDIHEGLALGVQSGLFPISGPVDLGTEFRYLYAHSSDGILLELEGAPFVKDQEPRFWVGHVAYVAQDIERLVEFYGRVLSLKPSPVLHLGSNPLFDKVTGLSGVNLSAMWLPGFNLGLEFWQYHCPSLARNHANPSSGFTHVCFESDDFDKDYRHVLASGATIDPSLDIGLADSRVASFKDPEGNCFSLLAFDYAHHKMAICNLPNLRILDHIAAQRP